MTSYPFISELFTNVLSLSAAIEGRFYVCPKMGNEINSDVLGQVLTDIKAPTKKYPLVLMMPPRITGKVNADFSNYSITLFFLKTTYYGAGSNISSYTKTSQHTIEQDWHDMARCANAFLKVLNDLQRMKRGMLEFFRMPSTERMMHPVSEIGVDMVSGVRIDFEIQLSNGCEIEDYNAGDISLITIPDGDSHPEHKL